jgi:hypothetical protein
MLIRSSIRHLATAFLLLLAVRLPGQSAGLYPIDSIQQISLTFTQSNWDYQLDTATTGADGYLIAVQCVINGVTFDSVGVKYKGNSSYNANNAKNPMHIKLDYIKGGQDYQGHQDIKLGNGFKDPSMIREVLAYQILRQYMHASQSNFAWVQVNGTPIGLYANSQDVGKKFAGDHFYSTDNPFFKCNPVYGSGSTPDLLYYGTDSATYTNRYELQSDFGWKELLQALDTLNNATPFISDVIDPDRALWMLAFDNLTVNLDSYLGALKQNYYLYQDHHGRFNAIVWDLNEAFGTFSNGGTGPLNFTALTNLSPTFHSTDAGWPLVVKLLANPRYKRMYIAHMKTMLAENFANGQYVTWAGQLQATISAAVQADGNKFYTYAQFQNGLTQNVTGMGTIYGISNIMTPRTAYLQGTTEFAQVPPTLGAISLSSSNPALGDTVWVSLPIATTNYAYLGYRSLSADRFTYATLLDDGQHHDGSAGDGIFGAALPMTGAQAQYYVYAENNNAGIFSPARAEHEFYSLSATVNAIAPGAIVVNEFMAANQSTVTDPAGQYADWIELYNTTGTLVSLSGLYLTDNLSNPTKWAFPSNATLAPGAYLIVWCDEDVFESGYHTNFKLSAAGESIQLAYASGSVIDSLSYGPQSADISLQRCPNGSGPFTAFAPSYAAVNTCMVAGIDAAAPALVAYPNPASTLLHIRNLPQGQSLRLYNTLMQELPLRVSQADETVHLDVSELPNGLYFLQLQGRPALRFIVAR